MGSAFWLFYVGNNNNEHPSKITPEKNILNYYLFGGGGEGTVSLLF